MMSHNITWLVRVNLHKVIILSWIYVALILLYVENDYRERDVLIESIVAKQSLSFEDFRPGTVVIADFVAPLIGRVVMDFNSGDGNILLHISAHYTFNDFQNVS